MPNGLVIEISNTSNSEVTVPFFREDALTSGVTIRTRNTAYDYASLLTIAHTEGFSGSGIITDDERASQLTIYRNHQPTQYLFSKILDGLEIFIDGKENYMLLNFPPMSTTLVQLMPRFDVR